MKKRLIAAIVTLGLAMLPGAVAAAQEQVAIVGGTLIDGNGGNPVADAAIVIEGTRIVAVGPRTDTNIPPGARRVDARGKYITPGLIDSNVHLVLMIVPEFYIKYEDRLEEVALQSAQIALKYGVTTVRDSWGPLEPLLRARDRIDRGEVPGSRMLVAGNIVGLGGPFSEYFLGERGAWVSPLVRERINAAWEENVGPELLRMRPEEVRQEMRRYLARGVDFVKVAVSAHGVRGEPLMFSVEALEAMAEEIHAAGKIYETHTATPESLRLAVESGADLLQHPESVGDAEVPDDVLAAIKENRVFCAILTRFWMPELIEKEKALYPDWFGAMGVRDYEGRFRNVEKMLGAGVRLAMATDMGPQTWELAYRPMSPLIGRVHFLTMEDYQEAGLSPMEVLIASTKTGAEASQMEDDLGTLEVGKIADLLILDANPLSDIANMRRIDQVMKEGVFVDRQSLPENPVMQFDPETEFGDFIKGVGQQ